MARSMWTGVISFGMVTIPVKLFTATESHNVAFHQLHEKCSTRIKEHRWCPHCKREVDWDEIVKGFEHSKGSYVELTEEDFERLPLSSKHTIEVSAFVPAVEIDPIFLDTTYYVGVEGKGAQKPYKLLTQVMQEQNVVGIATITFRNKERVCALRPTDGRLCLETLFYDDEIKPNSTERSSVSISPAEKKMAQTLVKSLASSFKPAKFKDKYQAAVKKLINAKIKGKEIAISQPKEATPVNDLMDMLRASIDGVKQGNHNEAPKAKTKPVRKSAAKRKKTRSKKAA